MYSVAQVADMLGISKETLRRWDNNGKLTPVRNSTNNHSFYSKEQLKQFDKLHFIFDDSERLIPTAASVYKTIELFAGAGGLGIGLEKAGLYTVLLNEIDKNACATLKHNRPQWNVVCGDIANIDFPLTETKLKSSLVASPARHSVMLAKKWVLRMLEGHFFSSLRGQSRKQGPSCLWLRMCGDCSITTTGAPWKISNLLLMN